MKELWILGFVVNLFLLGSVFDIYFKSPIVDVPAVHCCSYPSGVSRVVFFVADGLRADTFFKNPNLRPRLSELMDKRKNIAWGISDTRVPTESRPGHIALFAGFYEDPSAVFTGWKDNLVEFDSVFNRTEKAIALGSPDVVNMFARGAAKSKIYSETYPSDWQDFLEGNSSHLDTWVYERFQILVKDKKLPAHKNSLIFLHLLGIDNTGHVTKPHSREYEQGLRIVDDIVLKVEKNISEYYNDDHTLYIFTSDHGMTDWGSHGGGSKDETETPFLIWGPGIKSTTNYRLKQADFTSLIAGALGSAYATNSVGKFPTSLWKDKLFAYEALKANFYQIHELMKTKKLRIGSERNFKLLDFFLEPEFLSRFEIAESKALEGNHDQAIILLENLFLDVLEGNSYYERYDQQLLIVFSVLTFFGLMSLIGIIVLTMSPTNNKKKNQIFSLKLGAASLVLALILTKCLIGWSLWKIGYGFMPTYLAFMVSSKIRLIKKKLLLHGKLVIGLVLSAFGIQMLVLSFFHRSVLSLALILNLIWALLVHQKRRRHLLLILSGPVGTLALFPLVPTIGNSHSPFFRTIGPIFSSGLVLLVIKWGNGMNCMNQRSKTVLGLQLFLLSSVAVLVHFPTFFITRIVSWTSLALSFLSPTISGSPNYLTYRLISIFLGIATPFSFLGISYETLFLPSLFLVLLLLLKLEVNEEEGMQTSWSEFLKLSNYRDELRRDDVNVKEKINVHRAFRRAWFHLFFIFMSFFGTGNIGSVSSFDPSSTRCFVSVFNPWIMMILMLVKILGPFLLVSSFWHGLLPSRTDVERNFGILLLFCQGMGLHMFFRVTNQGSWLEIGTSISHFVIVQSTTLFLFLLHFIAKFLMTSELLGKNGKESNFPTRSNFIAKSANKASKGY